MPLLEIRNLKKIYRTPEGETLTVLDVTEFALEERQQLALCGASGTGKTTFLNCIAGILRPNNGSVRLNGIDMAAASEGRRDQLRAQTIGYIFQTFNLLQGYTCLENVLLGMSFGRGADRAFARELLKRVGLGDRLDYRPAQLSVGQQQRVAVARALANRPKLVLADEPTGNLDATTGAHITELLFTLNRERGTTLVLVTHEQALADHCQRRFEMSDGELREQVVCA